MIPRIYQFSLKIFDVPFLENDLFSWFVLTVPKWSVLTKKIYLSSTGLPPLHSLSIKSGQESVTGGGSGVVGGQVNLAPCQAKNIEDVEVLPIDELFGDTPVNMNQVILPKGTFFN